MFYLLVLLIFCGSLGSVCCLEKEITVNVDPLKQDCFFQSLKVSESVEIEYQVIGGGHGDLDISFSMVDPTGRILVADFKKSENNHKFDVQMNGDFRFCFDNTFSSFNTKTVFFELIVDNSIEDQWGSEENYNFVGNNDQIEKVKIEEVQDIVNSLRNHLNKARLLQELIKSTEAKDRNVAEETYFKVNIYSMFILTLMILVSFIQIVMVKSLFDNQSKIHHLWNYLDKYK